LALAEKKKGALDLREEEGRLRGQKERLLLHYQGEKVDSTTRKIIPPGFLE